MLTGQLEVINHKIKVIKRVACGQRDSDHYLKLNGTFPSNP